MNTPIDFMSAAARIATDEDARKLSILLVDDEPELLRVYRLLLEMNGYRILTAENGRDALRIAAVERPSLIFCDLLMPGMDGIEVLRALRRAEATRHIPFVFLSGSSADEAAKIRTARNEAAAYIAKPCSIARIRTVIEELARRFDLLQENLSLAESIKRRSA